MFWWLIKSKHPTPHRDQTSLREWKKTSSELRERRPNLCDNNFTFLCLILKWILPQHYFLLQQRSVNNTKSKSEDTVKKKRKRKEKSILLQYCVIWSELNGSLDRSSDYSQSERFDSGRRMKRLLTKETVVGTYKHTQTRTYCLDEFPLMAPCWRRRIKCI